MYELIIAKHVAKRLCKEEKWQSISVKLQNRLYEVGKVLSSTFGKLREVKIGTYRLYFTIIESTSQIEILGYVHILAYKHKDEQRAFLNSEKTYEALLMSSKAS